MDRPHSPAPAAMIVEQAGTAGADSWWVVERDWHFTGGWRSTNCTRGRGTQKKSILVMGHVYPPFLTCTQRPAAVVLVDTHKTPTLPRCIV